MQFARGNEEFKTESYVLRLTPSQRKALSTMATEDGITIAEVLRRGLDLYARNRVSHSRPSHPSGHRT